MHLSTRLKLRRTRVWVFVCALSMWNPLGYVAHAQESSEADREASSSDSGRALRSEQDALDSSSESSRSEGALRPRIEVLDEDGFPVENARLAVFTTDENGELREVLALGRTDDNGVLEVDVSRTGIIDVAVEAPGLEPAFTTCVFSERPICRLIMAVPVDGGVVATVTASRRPETDSTVQTQVITRESMIRGGQRNAAEALEEQGALQATRTFSGTTVSLRGLDSEYVLILVDGERLPGAIGGGVDLTRFSTEDIERIEVVRGSAAAIYGADAIAGVVNIITRQAEEPFAGSVSVGVGNNGVYDLSAAASSRIADWIGVSVSAGVHNNGAFQLDETQDAGEGSSAAGSARRQWNVGGRLNFYRGDHEVRIAGSYMRNDLRGVDRGGGGAVLDRRQLQEQSLTSLAHTYSRGRFTLQNRASVSFFRGQFASDQRGSDALDRYEDNRELQTQLVSMGSVEVGDDHTLTLGAEQFMQRLDSDRLVRDTRRYRFGVFAQHDWLAWQDGESSFRVSAGARIDADSYFGRQLSPKLAMRLDLGERLTLRASYGRGFRAPSFQQQFLRFENPSVGYVVFGNPNLEAERSHSVDLSATVRATEYLSFNLAIFRNDLSNMIGVVSRNSSAGGVEFSYDNISRAWTMGLESSVRVGGNKYINASVSYAFIATRDLDLDRPFEGQARHRLSTLVDLRVPEWGLGFVLRGALNADRVFYTQQEEPQRVDLNVLAPFDVRLYARFFDEHLEVFVGADNLFDAGDAYAVLLPRTFYGGARAVY